MARIAGVNIPTNKRVIIALTYIHGIGRTKAVEIADKLGIDTLVLKDDAERRHWRHALAEQHRDQDAIDKMRQRRKLERKLARDKKASTA